jgi:hypothetical protein
LRLVRFSVAPAAAKENHRLIEHVTFTLVHPFQFGKQIRKLFHAPQKEGRAITQTLKRLARSAEASPAIHQRPPALWAMQQKELSRVAN